VAIHWLRLFCRAIVVATACLSLVGSLGGCALFSKDVWSIDHYRDDRAVDIDKRLSENTPIVKNPF